MFENKIPIYKLATVVGTLASRVRGSRFDSRLGLVCLSSAYSILITFTQTIVILQLRKKNITNPIMEIKSFAIASQ